MPVTKIAPDELLRRTWALLHAQGYNGTSLADIAREAGIAKAGVLHHFGTKEGLMRAVIDWARIQYGKYVLSVFAKAETRSDGTRWTLEARLDEVLKRQFHLATLNGQAGCFFGNCILETGGKGPFAAALHHIYRDWMAAATLALSERFCVAEAEVRARQLFAEYQGTILLYKLLGDSSLLVGFRQNSVAALSMTIPMTTVPDTLPRTNPS